MTDYGDCDCDCVIVTVARRGGVAAWRLGGVGVGACLPACLSG